MKYRISVTLFFLLIAIPFMLCAQLKKDSKQPDFTSILSKPAESYLFGLMDPSKFQMSHQFSMSFGMAGNAQMLQNTYVNSMNFLLSEDLMLTTDLGIMSTPYHTFGENSFLNTPQFFGAAELNYKISDQSFLKLRFEKSPYGYYSPYGYDNRYYNPFYRPLNDNNFTE